MAEQYTFTVNGKCVSTSKQTSMLRFLRDELHLHSVKDGCSEGACGACMILVDGKPTRACVLKTQRAVGKEIVTVEGLTDHEKEAFVYEFGVSGSVQCGFCTPGMVISAAGLLRQSPDPSDEEIKTAIRGNLCRCTGYRKIIECIRLAGQVLRGEKKIDYEPEQEDYGRVGTRTFRVDVRKKVLGTGKYPDDIEIEDVWQNLNRAYGLEEDVPYRRRSRELESAASLPEGLEMSQERAALARRDGSIYDGNAENRSDVYGFDASAMAYASCVRAAYPRAIVRKIDLSEARQVPGVIGILTAADVPHNKVGHIQQDWDVMIAEGDTTRMVGDAICLVVAENRDALEEAKKLVHVDYEVLEPVRNIDEARRPDAPKIHEAGNLCQSRHVTRGDARRALKASKYTVTETFETPFTEHAFLEPECAVAFPYKDGVKILSTDQGAYDTRREVAIMFGWDPKRVVVENQLIGGGFGGKEDVSAQHIAALAAWTYKRAVKVHFSRQESINFHPKRHAMKATFTLGCDEHGKFTGLDCEIFFDTGAYASLCGPVLERACTHAVGPYTYQNTDIRGYGYYTNNPPAGAFRGFGVTQSEFALECVIDLLAKKAGLSPWEIRFRNAIEPGLVLPNGQIADGSTALKETLLAVRDVFEKNSGHAGIACAMKNAGVGVGLPDKGRARLQVEKGDVVIYSAASDIGQGCLTVFCQDVAEITGLPMSRIRNAVSNTENAPDSGTTSGSRQTLLTGEAVRGAGRKLREALDAADGKLSRLEGQAFSYVYFEPTDKLGAAKPNPKSHIAYAYATNVAVLDDEGRVTDIYAAYDAGRVINPLSIEGQIEGGVLMSMGYGVTEDFPLKDCVPKARFGTLGLLRATQIPEIHAIMVHHEPKEGEIETAFGAKGIGEITAIPAAPAIAGAYYELDGKLRTKLPLEDTYYRKKQK
ncbi:selenium-dependent xanthine dehydrogenase [Porcincola intestinalis]|uniref:selenium-dependent xanthine dehydrogenase n=1 Tax=Porcincola intestinalis TaxID=2606632 RepID=UPI002A834588|nr:selenium-dependent xanthine dehydrogenase [Porcincola intestinalis]MDY4205539.1 selenium-dependent xanthine dehydrogenase [Porcincola intestinalis]